MKHDVIEESDAVLGARMKELFVAQHDKPSALGEINLSRLTPFQRGMLVTDGTVTRFIEAYTMAPVEVVRLQQSERMLSGGHPWLELPIGAKVISRQSVIRAHTPNGSPSTIHVYADSLIVPHRLPKSFLDALTSDREGLGGLLRQIGLETRRELLWCGMESLGGLPGAVAHLEGGKFISRSYRVIAKQKTIMLINEKFPLSVT